MNSEDALKRIPKEGFLKIQSPHGAEVPSSERAALIRKGNQVFNAGNIELAKRIFLTARYGDGISRVGDHYLAKNDPLEALRMYWIAPAPDKVEKMIERLSSVVSTWLTEGKETGTSK